MSLTINFAFCCLVFELSTVFELRSFDYQRDWTAISSPPSIKSERVGPLAGSTGLCTILWTTSLEASYRQVVPANTWPELPTDEWSVFPVCGLLRPYTSDRLSHGEHHWNRDILLVNRFFECRSSGFGAARHNIDRENSKAGRKATQWGSNGWNASGT